ncbi:phage antirepressor KilAC domain-containing protein [Limosilactobacillus vaginalis]|uniref:phage antirepressor KilAC domain-containing protein n=1 Tax=Limosilactobacillus vaginalis TaxID=1633 RepID=UPI003736D89D
MKETQLFNFKGQQVRTVTINNEPYFVATDVTKILGLTNTTVALSRLDEDERSKFNLGRQGKANVVNEYGLYELIIASRKSEAHEFKRWITHEVLPSIRKHGAYMTPQTIEKALLSPDTIINLATQLKEEQEQRKHLQEENEQMKPKALFADAVSTSNSSILIGQLAKILRQNGVSIGQNRLFAWMRKHGYLGTRGSNRNVPTQRSMELGLFKTKETVINHSDGHTTVNITTKVTGKGQQYFIQKFLGEVTYAEMEK